MGFAEYSNYDGLGLAVIKREPRKLRIAFATRRLDGEAFNPECKAATEAAAKLCEKLGHLMEVWAPIASYVPFTGLQNITGQLAISMPLAFSKSGLPIGVQFVRRFC